MCCVGRWIVCSSFVKLNHVLIFYFISTFSNSFTLLHEKFFPLDELHLRVLYASRPFVFYDCKPT